MKYRPIGASGLKVSALGLGNYLTMGLACSKEESKALVRTAYDAGINYFDTANAYAAGEAERILGICLKDYPRSDLVILTKVWAPMGQGPNDRGLSAKHIREQCDASLRRLGMDYVDIYLCHRPDPFTPLEETVRAMEDLARAGKILYWGISEWPAEMMAAANDTARRLLARPMTVSQPRYNLVYRHPEEVLFPFTREAGIGNVIFSPLAHGILTGKYAPNAEAPEGTRAADPRQNGVMRSMYWDDALRFKAQELARIAGNHGLTAAQLAIAWCLRHPAVSSVILGATSVEQLAQNIAVGDFSGDDALWTEVEDLFPLSASVPKL
jgi:voltage-dependent potassium channel beta subunit